MKKRILILLIIGIFCTLTFMACGSPSIDSIKQKYLDAGYRVTTLSENAKNDVAGVVEGFNAEIVREEDHSNFYLSVSVFIFNKKGLADEYKSRQLDTTVVSIKNETYLCRIFSMCTRSGLSTEYFTDSEEVLVALDMFNSSF